MHDISIEGYQIRTKCKLYKAQEQSIETILKCLKNKESGMIESPTGTGKSLSILAAVQAWVEKEVRENNESKPKIFITTRTIKQACQLIEHLKKMDNPPEMSLLASRKNLCLNEDVRKAKDIDTACKNKIKKGDKEDMCKYYYNQNDKDGKSSNLKNSLSDVFTIEDLLSSGKSCKTCPYYYTRERQSKATIIFSPYNYIINRSIREAMRIDINEAVVIVDEAHNIDDSCRSAGSVELTRSFIDKMISILGSSNTHNPELENDRAIVLAVVQKIRDYMDSIPQKLSSMKSTVSNLKGDKEASISTSQIVEELNKLGIIKETFESLSASISNITSSYNIEIYLEQCFKQMLFVFKQIIEKGMSPKYGMIIANDKISFLLLHGAVIFNEVLDQARCVVLLSGTLQPFNEMAAELSSTPSLFKHFVQTDHIISQNQLKTVMVGSYNNTELLGTYAAIKKGNYYETVAALVIEISHMLEDIGGALCFVSSYSAVNELSKLLEKSVSLFKEPRSSEDFEHTLQGYRRKCRRGKCIFLCVFRGKASEGIDFRDHESRAVILLGIPYQSINDHSIILKKQYNDTYLLNSG